MFPTVAIVAYMYPPKLLRLPFYRSWHAVFLMWASSISDLYKFLVCESPSCWNWWEITQLWSKVKISCIIESALKWKAHYSGRHVPILDVHSKAIYTGFICCSRYNIVCRSGTVIYVPEIGFAARELVGHDIIIGSNVFDITHTCHYREIVFFTLNI